jgi:WD40 repeat protein
MLASAGSTAFIGGSFGRVGPAVGSAVQFDASSGAPVAFPQFAGGSVTAAVGDGSGGWYVGGDFDRVAGAVRYGLAHVRADGTVDAAFPQLGHEPLSVFNTNESVQTLALSADGQTLWVGGFFDQIGGLPRYGIAAISTATDTVTSWVAELAGTLPSVSQIVLGSGTTAGSVFVGGSFTGALGNLAAADLVKLSTSTGMADPAFTPDPTAGGSAASTILYALALSSSGSGLYVGGYFDKVGGQNRSDLARVATTGGSEGQAEAWDPNPDGEVFSVGVPAGGGTAYVAGQFSNIGGAARGGVAAIDSGTGNATAWNVGLSQLEVTSIAFAGADLLLVGDFSAIASQPRPGVALVSLATAAPDAFDPSIAGDVVIGAVSGSHVLVGGPPLVGAGSDRMTLAQLDPFGHATAFAPQFSGGFPDAIALAPDARTLYVGGSFTAVDGQPRAGLAAFDTATGALSSWQSGVHGGEAGLLTVSGDGRTLYVAGSFDHLGSDNQPRAKLGAVSTTDGKATAWNPGISGGFGAVDALALSPDSVTVYVGGSFTTAGHNLQPRTNLAAISSAGAGDATAWAPNPSGGPGPEVRALAVAADGTVYAAGQFTKAGDNALARTDLAAISATGAGDATSWNPTVSTSDTGNPAFVHALALSSDGTTLFAGGRFDSIGGQPRTDLAELSVAGATATAWNPDPGPYFSAVVGLAQSGGAVRAVGRFERIGDDTVNGYAQFTSLPAITAAPTLTGTAQDHQTLTCSPGTFSNSPLSTALVWTRDGTAISGQTGTTYKVVGSDSGHALACTETAANARGSATATSAAKRPGPYITKFSLTSSRISLAALPASLRPVAVVARAHRRYYFKFSLTEKARVSIEIRRLDKGVSSHGKCRARSKHRHGRSCTRHVKIGTLTRNVNSGSHKLRMHRKVGHHKLNRAHYEAIISARDTHNGGSNKKTIKFRTV